MATNLSSDFNEFVEQAENTHVEKTKQQLVDVYKQNNSWQPILNDIQIWRDIVDPKPERRQPPPPRQERNPDNRPSKPNGERPPPPKIEQEKPADFLKTGRRLSLYDANINQIVGKQFLSENPRSEAIKLNGETIGWLGLVPSNAIKDSPASEFLSKQYQNFYYIGGLTIALAFIMALVLSRHLISPIKNIIAGTNKLIKGEYQNRIQKTTQDELGTLSDNFNNLANTLEKNQKNRFQWMSDTSHELRTPLTVLKSQLMAIQDGVFKADDKRIGLFIDEIDNLSHIVDDLYQLSSSDAGALTYKKDKLNPVALLEQVLENFQPKFKQHSLECDFSGLKNIQYNMLADKDRLRQLFSNLLENSCRYTDAGGQIQVIASVHKKMLEIQIQDSSPGVPKKVQQKLFERFYRVEQSRNRKHGGSGLGLSLCQQIVEAHQGSIAASDSTLGGLNMIIRFPHN